MFNKNDPLIGAVTKIMEQNETHRQVERKLCEELGIFSRDALPHEHRANYDALLEQRLSEAGKVLPDLTQKKMEVKPSKEYAQRMNADKDKKKSSENERARAFGLFRGYKKSMEEEVEQVDEISPATAYSYRSKSIDKMRKGLKPGKKRELSDIDKKNIINAANRTDRDYYNKKGQPAKEEVDLDETSHKMKEALHPNQRTLNVYKPEEDKLTKKDFEMLRAKKTMKEEEQLDEISRDLARRFIRKASDEKKSGSIKKDRTKGVELAGKKAYSIPSEPKVRATDEYSKMREKMVGKGTDRETTRKLVGESDDWFFGKKKKNNDSVTDMERPAKNKTSGYTYRHRESGKEISKDTKGKPSSEWKRLKEEEQLDENKMSDDDKASIALRKTVAKYKLKDAEKQTRPGYVKKQSDAWYQKMIKRANAKIEENTELDEAAKSKSQQRIMGMALAMRRGESDRGNREVARIATDMPRKELEKFAKTKHKGLPEKKNKIDESEFSLDGVMEEIARNLGEAKMKKITEDDPNKPYQEQPLSAAEKARASDQASSMQSSRPQAPAAVSSAPSPAMQQRIAGSERDDRSMQAAAAGRPSSVSTPAVRPAPITKPVSASQSVAQQVSGGKASGTMRNVAASLGQNSADMRNATQNVVRPGQADAASGTAATPKPVVSPTASPQQKAAIAQRTAQIKTNDAARTPDTQEPGFSGKAGQTMSQATRDAADSRDNTEKAAQATQRQAPTPSPTPEPKFGAAFAAARKAGQTEFSWNGKKFHTGQKGETRAQTQSALARNRARSGSVPTPPPRPAAATPGSPPRPSSAPTSSVPMPPRRPSSAPTSSVPMPPRRPSSGQQARGGMMAESLENTIRNIIKD
jgi:hypothetical protein